MLVFAGLIFKNYLQDREISRQRSKLKVLERRIKDMEDRLTK